MKFSSIVSYNLASVRINPDITCKTCYLRNTCGYIGKGCFKFKGSLLINDPCILVNTNEKYDYLYGKIKK